jgi:hypothetical protein
MAQLTKGMYGSQFVNASSLFGLRCGQMRGRDRIGHNSGWYNEAGEKLGWGDLSVADIRRISREIEPGELFIILGEQDSFWNFVTHYGAIGSMCRTKPEAESPGVEYVAEKCCLIVAKDRVCFVDRYSAPREGATVVLGNGLRCEVLTAAAARALIGS